MEMAPELLYGQNVYVPTAVNSYTYGYAEVGSPMDWYNHQNSLGYDAQDVYFPAFQTDGTQCVYYATPDNGSVHPSYSPYPMDPGYIVDGSYLPQEYVPDTDPTCQFQNHSMMPIVQLHNSLPMKQELGNGSMVPVKPLHTPQAPTNVLDSPMAAAKHSPKAKLSGNDCFACVGSDPQKWASAEKFQPTSKSSGQLKAHGSSNAEKHSGQRSPAIVAKSYTSRLIVGNSDGTIIIRPDQYNGNDLRVDNPYAKFFVIKSIGEADIHKSIKYGVWSSSSSGNSKLDCAYRDADRIAKRNSTKCPVFLFFSVNGSGHFCGLAEMVGPVDFHKDMDFWCQDKWTGCFPVRWHIIKDVPNYTLQNILLQNNENKPVTHSRDTQEVPYVPGISVLKILKDIKVKECLFDDFMRYEEDEARIKQCRWSKLSHNAPDFVPVSQRKSDASDLQMPKFGGVLIDRTLEIQNMSEKPHDCNGIKQQDAVEKQVGSEAGKENGHQENRFYGKQDNEKAPRSSTSQPQTSTLKMSMDGKQQYWKKVENPKPNPDGAGHGSSKLRENGVNISSAIVRLEAPEDDSIVAKVGSLTISSKTRKAEDKSPLVDVVTIGSLPIRVNKSVA
ncbi:YTH domain-containing protein ECT1 isoform X2 [Triticum aestivum]|uniref:YTH domain-containing protein ECT1 isoform X2 n=1 Tax=Triticum aestivum TaxID=4565 RepID=UPI001D013440|nr:YTH domain-containing protein ECT1-like isoform X2 [Triticum aestivum]